VDYAALIEEAGADALELNIYYLPTNIEISGLEVERFIWRFSQPFVRL
jgi:dihydroorotate dehydrogenase (fumarate)